MHLELSKSGVHKILKCHTLFLLIICRHLLEQGTSTSGHDVFWWAWHSLEARLETNTRWLYALLRHGNILTSSWEAGKDCLQWWQDSRRKEQTFLWWSIRFLRNTVSLHPELEHLIRSYWQTFRWSWEREAILILLSSEWWTQTARTVFQHQFTPYVIFCHLPAGYIK